MSEHLLQKPHVVIVGGGIGGCIAADRLLRANFEVTMVVETGPAKVEEIGAPARLWPHVAHGRGGTTAFWHNGLMLPAEDVLAGWPMPKAEIWPYFAQSYQMLGGMQATDIAAEADYLAKKHRAYGFPEDLLGPALVYPAQRRNMWQHLKLDGRVRVIEGRCLPLEKPEADQPVTHVIVQTAFGAEKVTGDVFVLAAGGLGTPGLISDLSEAAGRFYDDHPTGFVGQVTLRQNLADLWNYPSRENRARLRQSLLVRHKGVEVAFYLRPSFHLTNPGKRRRVVSGLGDLRNRPLDVRTYWKVFRCLDDVWDLLSFKFGLRQATRHYVVLMVAQQVASSQKSVFTKPDGSMVRHWHVPEAYLDDLEGAFRVLISRMGDLVVDWRVLPEWRQTFTSSSHHSGTARMATSPQEGACDAHGKAMGVDNVYVADGSLVPASGAANTGLAIGALALWVADKIVDKFRIKEEAGRVLQDNANSLKGELADVLVTGAGGYVGHAMREYAGQNGLQLVDTLEMDANPKLRARWCLHLANVHGNPHANQHLMQKVVADYGPRVEGWIVPMTFSTLHGQGSVDLSQFNAGLKPWTLSQYAAGKLLQEQVLQQVREQPVLLFYLPNIEGFNSPWALFKAQVEAFGIMSQRLPDSKAIMSRVRMEDVLRLWGAWIALSSESAGPGVQRFVLRQPELDLVTLQMAEQHAVSWQSLGLVGNAKFIIRKGVECGLALAWRLGLLGIVSRLLWPNACPPVRRRTYVAGEGPIRWEKWDPTLTQPAMGQSPDSVMPVA